MLTDAQVVALREQYAAGATQKELAAQFGVGQTTVSALVSGKTRARAGGPLAPSRTETKAAPKPAAEPSAKPAGKIRLARASSALTQERAQQVRDRVRAGESRQAVASSMGLSIHTVHSIMSGRRGDTTAPVTGRLTPEQVARVRALGTQGVAQTAIATAVGTSQQVVSGILAGRTYRDI